MSNLRLPLSKLSFAEQTTVEIGSIYVADSGDSMDLAVGFKVGVLEREPISGLLYLTGTSRFEFHSFRPRGPFDERTPKLVGDTGYKWRDLYANLEPLPPGSGPLESGQVGLLEQKPNFLLRLSGQDAGNDALYADLNELRSLATNHRVIKRWNLASFTHPVLFPSQAVEEHQ